MSTSCEHEEINDDNSVPIIDRPVTSNATTKINFQEKQQKKKIRKSNVNRKKDDLVYNQQQEIVNQQTDVGKSKQSKGEKENNWIRWL